MNLCDGTRRQPHTQIAYESQDCPACELVEQVEDLKAAVNELEVDVQRLNAATE
jgi:hypothetical protein